MIETLISTHGPRYLTPPRLFSGLLRPIPLPLIQRLATHCLTRFINQHPDAVARLDVLDGQKLAIFPDDLPHIFILEFKNNSLTLNLCKSIPEDETYDAHLFGSIHDLILLLEGAVDGDALFFKRQLRIEGDMELVLTLRNALDGADINFMDLLGGPDKGGFSPLRQLTQKAGGLYAMLCDDLAHIEDAILAPIDQRMTRLETEIGQMADQLENTQRELRNLKQKVKR
jgi:predicted lipid carrier protein YhbT